MTPEATPPEAADGAAGTLFVEEPRFAIVPEWVIDAPISDGAFRLYSLLLRYGNSTGCRMPSRPTLARRLRRSVDAVDRSMRQLTAAGTDDNDVLAVLFQDAHPMNLRSEMVPEETSAM